MQGRAFRTVLTSSHCSGMEQPEGFESESGLPLAKIGMAHLCVWSPRQNEAGGSGVIGRCTTSIFQHLLGVLDVHLPTPQSFFFVFK
jgi:hypothetical protein